MDIEFWIAFGQVLAGFGSFAGSIAFIVVLALAFSELVPVLQTGWRRR